MNLTTIATIRTPFSEKFAIPRQAQIVNEAVGKIQFIGDYRHLDSLNGLSAHSHYWLIWGFHQHIEKDKPLTVRPPRLGGNARVGVFATRSPFRPNDLGLSVVKLENIDTETFSVNVCGVDMLDNSPIYDIKPYIPYADCRYDAHSDWASAPPDRRFNVNIEASAQANLVAYDSKHGTRLVALIVQLLAYDPRPAYKADKDNDDKRYATRLYDMDIAWYIDNTTVTVVAATERQ